MPGFSISTSCARADVVGPTSGPVCATTNARIVARET